MSKLWQKTTSDTQSDSAQKVESFTVGNDYQLDQVLVPYDVKASKVHAKALHKAGILTKSELDKLTQGLSEIEQIWQKGSFEIRVQDEDMHTAIENYLTGKLGDLGKKIHTGRSRNDQVLTAVRLYEKDQIAIVAEKVKTLANAIIDFGVKYENIPLPGFTHTRKAMLSSVSLWAGGYAEMLLMQLEAVKGVTGLVDRSPLGSAAGFGTTLPIDREAESDDLGFSNVLVCSTTAQLSRGWVEVQLAQYLTNITSVLNRLASDIILYSSESYRFFELDDVVCTGSSIMPQKKNPDVAELIRGKHAQQMGFVATLQSLIMNLGSGYHRDLQLTKEPVIQSCTIAKECLDIACLLIQSVHVNATETENACTKEMFAAEAAYQMVENEGYTFREAYLKIKESPEKIPDYSAKEFLEKFSHLGAPGNPGLLKLKMQLNKLD